MARRWRSHWSTKPAGCWVSQAWARGASARNTATGSQAGWSGGTWQWQARQVTASTRIVVVQEGHVRTSPATSCARAAARARPSLDGSRTTTRAHGPPSTRRRTQPKLWCRWCEAIRAATMPQSHQIKTTRMRRVLLFPAPRVRPPQTPCSLGEEAAMAPGGSIGEVACPSHRLHPLGDTVSVLDGDVDLHQRMRHSWCAIAPAAVPAANAMHLAPLRNAFTRGTSPLPSMRHWVILGSRHAWAPSFLSVVLH